MLHGESNRNSRLEKLVTEIMGLGYSFVMTFLLFFFQHKSRLEPDTFVLNSMLNLYGRLGQFER
jgi:hypothetical protein